MLETTEFRDKKEGEIQRASNDDAEIQDVKRNLDEGRTEMKGVALGLCQWKESLLWYQGTLWIPNDEGIRTALIAKHHEPLQAGNGGTAKTTELMSRGYCWPQIREDIKRFVKKCDTVKGPKWSDMHPTDCYSQTRPLIEHGNQSLWTSLWTCRNQKDMTPYWWLSIG